MATMKRIGAPACDEKGCKRSATQTVMAGDNGPTIGNFCGGHAMKHLNATAKQEGQAK